MSIGQRSRSETLSSLNAQTTKIQGSQDLASQVVFEITGTFSATLTFYGRVPGSSGGVALLARNVNNGAEVTTSTATGLFRADANGLEVWVEITSYTSGSAVVRWLETIG